MYGFPVYIDGYEDYSTEADMVRLARSEYNRLGLSIFESFEEYMQDKEECEH